MTEIILVDRKSLFKVLQNKLYKIGSFQQQGDETHKKGGGRRGHWAVYYTCPQSFIIKFLIVGSTTLGIFLYFVVGSLS